MTSALNRQQLCAALSISESTVRRLERDGLPYTPVGIRSKRYDLQECRTWLRLHQPSCPSGKTNGADTTSASWSTGNEFTELCRRVQVRVKPSSLTAS